MPGCSSSALRRDGSTRPGSDTLVDLIFRPSGGAVDDPMFARATEIDVMAQTLRVASIDDVLATKVLALNEQDPNFRSVLEIARALREQVDWQHVRSRVDESPFGAAFMTLVERLRIASEAELGTPPLAH